jgi:siroheme synthase (precorrin-2 oxidase/ferrochelatase)
VGGRLAQLPMYRTLVQRHGGIFEHHDGGIEERSQRLADRLAAADLVLCQAGCVNHNAYARVKEHCKRHAKPCVFIDKPGASSFMRALQTLAWHCAERRQAA